MKERQLHIVSFDIPCPPFYGGTIDVFYKLKSLAEQGIKITLHAYYKGKKRPINELGELEKYCRKIHLYPRNMSWRKAVGTTPFIIASRSHEELINNLRSDDAPILLEGVHATAVLGHPELKERTVFLRMHNIEWSYYYGLAQQETNPLKKWYFNIEGKRLHRQARDLKKADRLLMISRHEYDVMQLLFDCDYLPPFHGNDEITARPGMGNYALYHGNLSVIENRKAVEYLISKVFSQLDYPLKIAGSGPPSDWLRKWSSQAEFVIEPDDESLLELIREAHMNVLVTFQNTGVKLKMINAMYNGRHCVVNGRMVEGSSLRQICQVGNNEEELKAIIQRLSAIDFTADMSMEREKVLKAEFDDQKNAAQLIEWLYPHP